MAVDALPGRQEGRQRALVGGLDLLAQRGERRPPQAPQHLGVTPLRLAGPPAGAQLAAHDLAVALQPLQDGGRIDVVAGAQLAGRERAVRARVARDELAQRVGHVGEEGRGEPAGRHRPERVAVQPRVVGGDPALLTADPQRDRAALRDERLDHRVGVDPGQDAVVYLGGGQVADAAQHVGQRVARLGAGAIGAVLQVGLDLLECPGVDELAQLLLAEQLAKQVPVQ